MNIKSVDLNLLLVFDAILRERNITIAANRIGLSQPAMSNALARLRRVLNDPLFVRTAHGMEPTPYAEQIAKPLKKACEMIAEALQMNASFDPLTSTRTLSFYMTDLGQAVFLPAILSRAQKLAPGLSFRVMPLPPRGAEIAMAAGEVDIAVGLFPSLRAGFFEQRLYKDVFVCIARADHPEIGNTLTAKQFVEIPHLLVSSQGTGHNAAVEKIIAKQRVKRVITLTVPHFLVLPTIVAQTDYIATVPQKLAKSLLNATNVKMVKPPIEFPSIEIKQHWHERFHHDPANKWLRSIIAELFRD